MMDSRPVENLKENRDQALRRFKRVYFLGGGLFLGLLLAAVVLFWTAPGGGPSNPPPSTGTPVPDFTLRDLSGNEVTLSALAGKPVVINFWATWCPPCRDEMPVLDAASRRLAGQVYFLAVDFDESSDIVIGFAREHELSLPLLLDPGGVVTDRYYVQSFPTTFFVDAQGRLRAQHIGSLDANLLDHYLTAVGLTGAAP